MSGAMPREIEAAVLRALAERGQAAIADAAGVSETRLSRWKNHNDNGGGLDLEETARVLSILGLRVVPVAVGITINVNADAWHALHVLLRDHCDSVARSAAT